MDVSREVNEGCFHQAALTALAVYDAGSERRRRHLGSESLAQIPSGTGERDIVFRETGTSLGTKKYCLTTLDKGSNAMDPRQGRQHYGDNRQDFYAISRAAHKPEMESDASWGSGEGNRSLPLRDGRTAEDDAVSVQREGLMDQTSEGNEDLSCCGSHNGDGDSLSSVSLSELSENVSGSFTLSSTVFSRPGPIRLFKDTATREGIWLFKGHELGLRDSPASSVHSWTEDTDSPCLDVKESIPHSNSLTGQGHLLSSFVNKHGESGGTMKKDYSFPTMHNEIPHHSVNSPSYKLTCTPTSAPPNPDESVDYPINVTNDLFNFHMTNLNIASVLQQRILRNGDTKTVARSNSDSVLEPDMNTTANPPQAHLQADPRPVSESDSHSSQEMIFMKPCPPHTDYETPETESKEIFREGIPGVFSNMETDETRSAGEVIEFIDKIAQDESARLEAKYISPMPNLAASPRQTFNGKTLASSCDDNRPSLGFSNMLNSSSGHPHVAEIVPPSSDERHFKKAVLRSHSDQTPVRSQNNVPDPALCRFDGDKGPGVETETVNAAKDKAKPRRASLSTTTPAKNGRTTTCRQMEVQHVHQVYKQIAPHCDHVQHKAWPKVKRFLKDLEPGSLVADVGCGNGRYLNVNPSILKFGCDPCRPFLNQARGQGHEVMMADNIALPFRDATFDAVISIGVIHHFASLERRIAALSELSRILSPGGRLMVYVWAFEQLHRKFESQDVLIPWVKPEVKDHSRRNTISCSSEPERTSLSSVGSSASEEDAFTTTSKRRRRVERHRSECADILRPRSRSADAGNTLLADNDDSSPANSSRLDHLKYGVFDRRDSGGPRAKRRLARGNRINGDDCSTFEDTNTPARSGHDQILHLVSTEDSKAISRWPGQLVSECRKLGKFLRSLSSKSDSQVDGNDHEDTDRRMSVDWGFRSNGDANSGLRMPQGLASKTQHKPAKDFTDNDSQMAASNRRESIKSSSEKVYADHVSQTNPTIGREVTKDCCDYDQRAGSEDTVQTLHDQAPGDSAGTSVGNDCSCDIYDNNNVAQTTVATSYHHVQPTAASPLYTADTPMSFRGTTVTHHDSTFVHVHSVSSCQTDELSDEDAAGDRPGTDATTLRYLQLPTPMLVSSSADESDGASSGNQGGNSPFSFIQSNTDTNPNLESLLEKDKIILREEGTTNASDGPKSNDSSSPHSDKTTSDSKASKQSRIHPIQDDSILDLHPPQNMYSHCRDRLSQTPPEVPLRSPFARKSNDSSFPANEQEHEALITGRTQSQALLDSRRFSECENPVHYFFRAELGRHHTSRSNTSTEVNCGASDLACSTDCLDTDSVFSLDQDKPGHRNSLSRPNSAASINFRAWNSESKPIPRSGFGKRGDFKGEENAGSTNINEASEDVPAFPEKDMAIPQQSHSHGQLPSNPEDVPPFRVVFRNIFSRIADVFRLRSQVAYKPFGSYQDGKPPAHKYLLDSDSSEIETSVSNISTHSSVYPTPHAYPKHNKDAGEDVSDDESDSSSTDNEVDDETFEVVDDGEIVSSEQKQPRIQEILSRFNPFKPQLPETGDTDEPNPTEDGKEQEDEETDPQKSQETLESAQKQYTFNVENLKTSPEKGDTFFRSLSQKWSSMLTKGKSTVSMKQCQHYSPVSLSSSGENENLRISLVDTDITSTKKPPSKVFTKRPSSLDFTKKRTRSKGRRPAPQKNCKIPAQEAGKLSLSEAMTLLGDGATEESVMERLDHSAQDVFAEMKRMNFAIREFPRSSLDSDGNEDPVKPKATQAPDDSHSEISQQAKPTKPSTLKMRSEKRRYAARRRFSDSITSQPVRSKRGRGLVQLQKEISNKSRKESRRKDRSLPRQYHSEELRASFDAFGIHYGREDIKVKQGTTEMFTPLASLQSSSVPSQNVSNNASAGQDNLQTNSDNRSEHHATDIKHSTTTATTLQATNKQQKECTVQVSHEATHAHTLANHNTSTKLCEAVLAQIDSIILEAESGKNIEQPHRGDTASVSESRDSLLPTSNQSSLEAFVNQSAKISTSSQGEETPAGLGSNQSKSDSSLSRYYHVFKKGELDELVANHVPSLKIVDTFYDHANWCIVAQKQ